MKQENKTKRKEQRKKRSEERRKINRRIVRTITKEQFEAIKKFNNSTISNIDVSKEEMLECLKNLFTIIVNSSYLDEVVRMTRNNVSNNWFDREVDKDFVEEVLANELENAEKSPKESVALKICYWSNRIAHHIEDEVVGKEI